jgi:transposase InsO family protein
MPAIVKIPETQEEYNEILSYLQSKTLSPKIENKARERSNFIRRCKKFELDDNNILYTKATSKYERRRVLPKFDKTLRDLVLNRFHDQSNHREYHKTYSAISEKHIGITQEEVREYVNHCEACALNASIKEKTDITPVISTKPWSHLQIDLIDFHEFKDVNDGYAWLLTCVCIFSKFLVAVPMKNKEAATVANHLVKDVFKIPGPPRILQSDNGKEFIAEIIKNICSTLNITIRHGRPRHPQSQGQIERLNQTIGRGFTKLLWDSNNQLQRKDWINIIDAFVISYNSTVHRAHYRTPHQVFFGWKMRGVYESPDTNLYDNNGNNDNNNETVENNDVVDDDNDVDKNNEDYDDDDNNNNSSSSSSNNNNNVIDDESDSASEDAVQRHLLKVLQVHQSVNNTLDKYRSKLCQKGSVHRKKHASNTIEAGTSGFIVPDHDNNQRTHKRKLQSTYSASNKETAF